MSARPLLIALDIDGTVILEDETFSPGIVDAVQHAVAAGHEVTVATGRSWESTEQFLRGLGISPTYAVCSNGAVLLQRNAEGGYDRREVETFDASKLLPVLGEHFPKGTFMVELADGIRLFTESMHDWNTTGGRQVPFHELGALPVARVVVVSPDETDEDFLRTIAKIGLDGITYAVGWSAWLDIAPHGVDKATALERMCELLEQPRDRVVVIGDGRNDIGMLTWAGGNGGRAIAMGQAPDEVRQAGTETTDSVVDGGVARILAAL